MDFPFEVFCSALERPHVVPQVLLNPQGCVRGLYAEPRLDLTALPSCLIGDPEGAMGIGHSSGRRDVGIDLRKWAGLRLSPRLVDRQRRGRGYGTVYRC